MGVPTSDVGYTSATTRRGDHKVHKGHVVAGTGKKKNIIKASNLLKGFIPVKKVVRCKRNGQRV
jgi:hypothetical protein